MKIPKTHNTVILDANGQIKSTYYAPSLWDKHDRNADKGPRIPNRFKMTPTVNFAREIGDRVDYGHETSTQTQRNEVQRPDASPGIWD